jgi:hypothetical protein
MHFFGHPGAYSVGYLRRLSCCSGGYFGFWHNTFSGHILGDGAFLNFCPYQQKTHGISFPRAVTTTRGRLHLCSVLTFYCAGLW